MSQKPNVDVIWQKLRDSSAPARKTTDPEKPSFERLWFGFNNDVKKQAQAASNKSRSVVAPGAIPKSEVAHVSTYTALGKGTAKLKDEPTSKVLEDHQHPEHLLLKAAAALKDPDVGTRRRALATIKEHTLTSSCQLTEDVLQNLVEVQLGKALLRRFDDTAEACRELAVTNLAGLLQAAPQSVLAVLPYAVPVLEERLQFAPNGSPVEVSEEVRLGLARLLVLLVQLADKALAAYAGEVVAMLLLLAKDPFHDINLQACTLALALDASLSNRLHAVSKEVVAALLPLATHKRHRVRVAAVRAVRAVMHRGAHEMILEMVAFRDPNVVAIKAFYGDDLKVNFCGKLASDPHVQVRAEFLALLGDWMLTLPERCDHESRLLPYLLSALTDDSPAVQAQALEILDALGQLYEREHAEELKDVLTYLPEEAHGLGWRDPPSLMVGGAMAAAAAEVCNTHGDGAGGAVSGHAGYVFRGAVGPSTAADGVDAAAALDSGSGASSSGAVQVVLPGPFTHRPRLGARILVQANLGRLLYALCSEIQSWQSETKRRCAQLLLTHLAAAEEQVSRHLAQLVPAMVKAILDKEVTDVIADCCLLLGCFGPLPLLLQLLGPLVADGAAGLGQHAAALTVMAHAVRGAAPRCDTADQLPQLYSLLESEAVLRCEDAAVRAAAGLLLKQLLAAAAAAAAVAGGAPTCPARLLRLCCYLRSAGRAAVDAASLRQAAEAELLISQLAAACRCSTDQLVAVHRAELIAQVDPSRSLQPSLDTSVLCRLMLTHSSAEALALLAAPDRAVITVVEAPEEAWAPRGSCPCPRATATASSANSANSAAALWNEEAWAAMLGQLQRQAHWLPSQPHSATLCLLCLEHCLQQVPVEVATACPVELAPAGTVPGAAKGCSSTGTAPAAAEEGDASASSGPTATSGEQHSAAAAATAAAASSGKLLPLLLQLLRQAHGAVLLLALRCLHMALLRGLLPAPELQAGLAGTLSSLVTGLSADNVPSRLQAYHVLQLLSALLGWQKLFAAGAQCGSCAVGKSETEGPNPSAGDVAAEAGMGAGAATGRSGSGGVRSDAAGPVLEVVDRVLRGLDDPCDDVRCLALRVVRALQKHCNGSEGGGTQCLDQNDTSAASMRAVLQRLTSDAGGGHDGEAAEGRAREFVQ